jgi:predicted Zn-dependent protease
MDEFNADIDNTPIRKSKKAMKFVVRVIDTKNDRVNKHTMTKYTSNTIKATYISSKGDRIRYASHHGKCYACLSQEHDSERAKSRWDMKKNITNDMNE